jgi:TM2 domain-containing membrane protein YozV
MYQEPDYPDNTGFLPVVRGQQDDLYGWGNWQGPQWLHAHTMPRRYPARPSVLPKQPGIALLLSLLLPGIGSIYAGKTAKGVWIMVAYLIAWLTAIILIGFGLAPAVWIFAMVAAYRDAVAFNARHGIIS